MPEFIRWNRGSKLRNNENRIDRSARLSSRDTLCREQRSNGEKYSSEYLIKMWVDPFVGGIYLTILVVRSQSIVVVVVIGNSSTIRKKGNFDN